MSELHLLIDDAKNLGTMDVIARTYQEGVDALSTLPVTHLYLDHDLGEDKSGYDLINWAIENGKVPPNVQIVSMNPVGRQNIERALISAGYVNTRTYWVKL